MCCLTWPCSHSSSSAIFKRDIEPIISPSPSSMHHQQINPHHIPCAKGTGQLEQSVLSILDSATAILTGMGTEDVANEVAVISPSTSAFDVIEHSSGFASPIGKLRSRSPSPVGSKVGQAASPRDEVQTPASILGLQNVGSFSPPPSTLSPPLKVPRPTIHIAWLITTAFIGKNVVSDVTLALAVATQTSSNDSTTSSQEPSPKTTTLEHFPPNVVGWRLPWLRFLSNPSPGQLNCISSWCLASFPAFSFTLESESAMKIIYRILINQVQRLITKGASFSANYSGRSILTPVFFQDCIPLQRSKSSSRNSSLHTPSI